MQVATAEAVAFSLIKIKKENPMIRKLHPSDQTQVANIWLDTNIKAHNFISPQYWNANFEPVKEMLLQAEVYIYENEFPNQIEGFIGLTNDYIEGIFVRPQSQSHGIGKQLLNFAKELKPQLTLHVYQKNTHAVNFYQRENFHIQAESTDPNTGEKEYFMQWKSS